MAQMTDFAPAIKDVKAQIETAFKAPLNFIIQPKYKDTLDTAVYFDAEGRHFAIYVEYTYEQDFGTKNSPRVDLTRLGDQLRATKSGKAILDKRGITAL